jgi:hypothetical protein
MENVDISVARKKAVQKYQQTDKYKRAKHEYYIRNREYLLMKANERYREFYKNKKL